MAVYIDVGEVDGMGVSSAQIALAWLLAQGKDIVPIPRSSDTKRCATACAPEVTSPRTIL